MFAAAPPPQPVQAYPAAVVAHFAVVRRERRPSDALDPQLAHNVLDESPPPGLNVELSRRLRGGDARTWVYLVPFDGGVCIFSGYGSGGCTSSRDAANGPSGEGVSLNGRDTFRIDGLVPDGYVGVRIVDRQGHERRTRIVDNYWRLTYRQGAISELPRTLRYVTARGVGPARSLPVDESFARALPPVRSIPAPQLRAFAPFRRRHRVVDRLPADARGGLFEVSPAYGAAPALARRIALPGGRASYRLFALPARGALCFGELYRSAGGDLGSGDACLRLDTFLHRGYTSVAACSPPARAGHVAFSGVLPDGPSSVRLSGGRARPRRVAVRGNAWSTQYPIAPGRFPTQARFRDRTGRTRTIRFHGLREVDQCPSIVVVP